MGLVHGILFSLDKIEKHSYFPGRERECVLPTAAGIYWFHWTQHLNPGVRKSVRPHLVLMYQRVGRWNGRALRVSSALKGGVQLHPPEDERTPTTQKSHPRKVLATAEGPCSLPCENTLRHEVPKVWWGEGVAVRSPRGVNDKARPKRVLLWDFLLPVGYIWLLDPHSLTYL